jgi:hypothetical protein
MKYFLVAFLASAAALAHAAETPSSLLGDYRSAPRKICHAGGGGHRAVCSRVADVMRIERTGYEGMRDAKVKAEFNLPDARICTFEGTGFWNSEGRQLVVADATTGCELSLTAEKRVLRSIVVRPEQCNSPCAGRTWLEGVVLRKQR